MTVPLNEIVSRQFLSHSSQRDASTIEFKSRTHIHRHRSVPSRTGVLKSYHLVRTYCTILLARVQSFSSDFRSNIFSCDSRSIHASFDVAVFFSSRTFLDFQRVFPYDLDAFRGDL